eukprot:CFRG1959T1
MPSYPIRPLWMVVPVLLLTVCTYIVQPTYAQYYHTYQPKKLIPEGSQAASVALQTTNLPPECDLIINVTVFTEEDRHIVDYEWTNVCLTGGTISIPLSFTGGGQKYECDLYENPLVAISVTGSVRDSRTLTVSIRDHGTADCVVSHHQINPTYALCTSGINNEAVTTIYDKIGLAKVHTGRSRRRSKRFRDKRKAKYSTDENAKIVLVDMNVDQSKKINRRINRREVINKIWYQAEIYIEITQKFVYAYGGLVWHALDAAMTTIAGANLILQRDVLITHRVTYMHIRPSGGGIFGNANMGDILKAWKEEQTTTPRLNMSTNRPIEYDSAHMFLLGSEAMEMGKSYQTGMCNEYKYSSSRYNVSMLASQNTMAHELLHTWGGSHCDYSKDPEHCIAHSMFESTFGTIQVHPFFTEPYVDLFRTKVEEKCLKLREIKFETDHTTNYSPT